MKKRQAIYLFVFCCFSLMSWTACDNLPANCPDAPPSTIDFLEKHVYNTGNDFRTTLIEDVFVNASEQSLEECNKVLKEMGNEDKKLVLKQLQKCDSLNQILLKRKTELKDVLQKIEGFTSKIPPPECPKGIWEDFGLMRYLSVVNPPWILISVTVRNPETGELFAANVPNKVTNTKDRDVSLMELDRISDLPKGESVIINVKRYNRETKTTEEADLRIVVE